MRQAHDFGELPRAPADSPTSRLAPLTAGNSARCLRTRTAPDILLFPIMNGYGIYGSSEEHQPVTHWRGYPIYAAHVIVIGFVASMIATSLLLFSTAAHVFTWLRFDNVHVIHGEVWRVLTYGLINRPSLEFAIDMLMLVWFGREVEKMIGRKKFLLLFGAIYLVTPLLFTALAPWTPLQLAGESGAFAVFVAFATLYPSALLFFNILAKWAALIVLGIYSLMALAARDWPALLALWGSAGAAHAFIRYEQGHFQLPSFRLGRRKPTLRVSTLR